MGLAERLRLVDTLELSDQERFVAHKRVLQAKPHFAEALSEIQKAMWNACERNALVNKGVRIELGTGVVSMKALDASVISSDIVSVSDLDVVFDAQHMPFADESVGRMYAQNVFHHLGNPDQFLSEVERILIPGGVVALLEPFHNTLSKFIYPRLFRTESYDLDGGWDNIQLSSMVGANQALSYIVFVRDRARYERNFPNLNLVEACVAPAGLRYLGSGGLNFISLLPRWAFPLLAKLDSRTMAKPWSIHWMVVLRKSLA